MDEQGKQLKQIRKVPFWSTQINAFGFQMNVYSFEFCWKWMAKRIMSKPVNANFRDISLNWFNDDIINTMLWNRTSNIWASIIKFYRNDFLSQMNSMSMHNISMESFVNQKKRERETAIERAASSSSMILVQCNMGLIFPSLIFCKHLDWINFWCNFIKWPRFKSFRTHFRLNKRKKSETN